MNNKFGGSSQPVVGNASSSPLKPGSAEPIKTIAQNAAGGDDEKYK